MTPYRVVTVDTDGATTQGQQYDDRAAAERRCRQAVAAGAPSAHVVRYARAPAVVYRVDCDELPALVVDYAWRAWVVPLGEHHDGVRFVADFALLTTGYPAPLRAVPRARRHDAAAVGTITSAAVVDGWLTATGTVHDKALRDDMRGRRAYPDAVIDIVEMRSHDDTGRVSMLSGRFVGMCVSPAPRFPGARFETE